MPKMINVTLPNDVHALLERIKQEKNFENNAQALTWIIRKAAGVEAQEEAST